MNDTPKYSALAVLIGIGFIYFFHITPFAIQGRVLPQVLSILDHGTLAMNDVMTGFRDYPDLARFQGYFYPGIAPGLAFVTVPLYGLLRFFLRLSGPDLFPGLTLGEESLVVFPVTFLLAALPALLVSYWLYRFAAEKGLSQRQALFIAALYAAGSPAFSYALTYNHAYHNLTNALAFYAFLEIFSAQSPRPARSYAAIGLCLGLLPFFWYPAGLASVILGGILLYREPGGALRFALPVFLAPIAVLLAYHWAAFGHPLSLPYLHRVDPATVNISKGFLGSGWPSLEIARKLLIGTHRGLFLTVPFAAVSFWSAGKLISAGGRRDHPDLYAAWAVFAVYFLWNTTRTQFWDGSIGIFGPRFLMPALPFLFVMLIHVFRRVPAAWAAALGAFSFLINAAGAHYRQPYDIDSLLLFLTKGPSFPIVKWLNAMPESARARFPDLFPVSHWGFLLVLVLSVGAYYGVLLLIGRREDP